MKKDGIAETLTFFTTKQNDLLTLAVFHHFSTLLDTYKTLTYNSLQFF